jgi:hypothetical protein
MFSSPELADLVGVFGRVDPQELVFEQFHGYGLKCR